MGFRCASRPGGQTGGLDGRALRPRQQFKRCNRELRFLRTRLGRLIRDIRRKTEDDAALREAFAAPLDRAMRIRQQRQQQRGRKLYSWHAPETECIGKGKAHRPYEFGVKVSITTTNRRCKGGCSMPRRCLAIPMTGTPWRM